MEGIVETPEEFSKEEEEYDDEVYEKIEAPKFVDFTRPDKPLPDDRSWFCLRIGCDQQHEVVDPEALYKSFVLRVLQARSPYSGLRKAQNRQASNANRKCPLSAPAKPSKPKMSRMTEISLVSQKPVEAKGKAPPISKLYSTPNGKKAKESSSTKALTTPSHKKSIPKQNPFRSVQNPKTPVAMPRSKLVAKTLVFNSPKKTEKTKTSSVPQSPVIEICSGLKKLDINSQRKKLIKSSSKSSRVIASSFNKSVTASCSSKSKLYTHKSKGRVKISPILKSLESKSVRSMKSKITRNLQKSHGPRPQDIVDNDSSDMEIDRKSRNGSVAVLSVAETSRNDEGNRREASPADEATITSEASLIRENLQAVATDVSCSNQASSILNSENNPQGKEPSQPRTLGSGQDEGEKENAYGRIIDLIQEKDSEEQKDVLLQTSNGIGVESAAKDGDDKEKTAASDDNKENKHGRNKDLVLKGENDSEEHVDVTVISSRIGVENEAREGDDKENTAASDDNRCLNPNNNRAQSKTGKHEMRENHQKVTDGQCKTSKCVSTVAPNCPLGGKHKKTMPTKPKPFRLRTDERGILREANLEKMHLQAPHDNTTLGLTEGNLQRKDGSEQQAKPTPLTTSKSVLEPKTAERQKKKPEVCTEKAARKFEYQKTTKSQLLRQQLTRPHRVIGVQRSVIKEASSTVSRPKNAKADKNVVTLKTSPSAIASAGRSTSRGRRAAAVPKELNFHRTRTPKKYTKTLTENISS